MLTHTGELPIFSAPTRDVHHVRHEAARLLGFSLLAAISLAAWSLGGATRTDANSRMLNAAPAVVVSLDRRASHNGRYQAEIVANDPLSIGRPQRWMLHLTQRNHRSLGHAFVSANSWAPETGERSPRAVTARYVGGGNYRLDGIYFPQAGWWNVSLIVDGSDGVDSVAFNVILPPR
jgi:hypothetical protein